MARWQTSQPKTASAVTKIFKITPEWWIWEIKWWWQRVGKTISKILGTCRVSRTRWAWGQIRWISRRFRSPIPIWEQNRLKSQILTYCKCTKTLKIWANSQFSVVASTQAWKSENLWLTQVTTSQTTSKHKRGMLIDSKAPTREQISIRQICWLTQKVQIRKIWKVKRGRIIWWNSTSNWSIHQCMDSPAQKSSRNHFSTILGFLNHMKSQKWGIHLKASKLCLFKEWSIFRTKCFFTSFTICHTKKHSSTPQMSCRIGVGFSVKTQFDGCKYHRKSRIKVLAKRVSK